MKKMKTLILVFLGLISCAEKNEFYDKSQRLEMRQYEPNILFTNYHILECDKYILLKRQAGNPNNKVENSEIEIKLNFLAGNKFIFNNQSKTISNNREEIILDSQNQKLQEENLDFWLNETRFTFPDVEAIKIINEEDFKELEVGTKIRWEPSGDNDNMLIGIKPVQEYCGKKGLKGQTYGTRPILVPDTGEYIINSKDLEFFDSGMEVGILFKRGKNLISEIKSEDKENNKICISNISFTNFTSKVK